MRIALKVCGIKNAVLRINAIKLQGEFSVEMPLLTEEAQGHEGMNIFGGMEIFMLNPPVVDVEFQHDPESQHHAHVLLPVRQAVRSVIVQMLTDSIGLVNRWFSPLLASIKKQSSDSLCRLNLFPRPHAMVRVKIVRAKNLVVGGRKSSKETAGAASSSSNSAPDPYCIARVGASY